MPRPGHRHDDPGEHLQFGASVDAGGVRVLLRDGEEELAQQEDTEGVAEQVRQDQRPQRAGEVQVGPHHVDGHLGHLRRQHHHHEDDDEGSGSPAPLQPRERIRRRDTREEHERRREARVQHRVAQVRGHGCLGEHFDVVLRMPRGGPELRRQRLLARHQRLQRDEDERRQEHRADRDRRGVVPHPADRTTAPARGSPHRGDGHRVPSAPCTRVPERRSSTRVTPRETTNMTTARAEA